MAAQLPASSAYIMLAILGHVPNATANGTALLVDKVLLLLALPGAVLGGATVAAAQHL